MGQRINVSSKDKDGIVTREKLTRHSTDCVDYWAVDFDYMSPKEIIKVAENLGLDVGWAPCTADDAPTPALVRTAHPTDVEQWSSPRSVDDLRLGIQAVHCGGCGFGVEHILLS